MNTWRNAQTDPPEYGVRVLVWFDRQATVAKRHYTDEKGDCYLIENTGRTTLFDPGKIRHDSTYNVRHWQPLPDPPEVV